MKIIDLKQGTPEWIKWRDAGLGASDLPVIMGTNPYKTPLQLWEEKCGYNKFTKMNASMKHGILNEGKSREMANEELNINLKPLCVEDDDISYFKASLDGWDEKTKTLVEIKCPTSVNVIRRIYEENAFPDYWFQQMQWQIALTNPEKAYLVVLDWQLNTNILIPIIADPNLHNEMKYKAKEFWNLVLTGQEPPPTNADYIEVEDEALELLMAEYIAADSKEKKSKQMKKELKEQIVEYGDDGSFQAYGVKVKRSYSAPRYDLSAMKKDGINIDKYKKEVNEIGFYKIILPKK